MPAAMGPVEQHGMGRDGGVEGVEHVQSHRRRRCSQSLPAHATTELKHASLLQLMMKPPHTPAPDNINRVELVPILAQLTCSTLVKSLSINHTAQCRPSRDSITSSSVGLYWFGACHQLNWHTHQLLVRMQLCLYERCTTAPPHHTQPMHSTIKHMSRPQPSNVHSRQ